MARATPAFEQILDELSREHEFKWRFFEDTYHLEKPISGTQLIFGVSIERGIEIFLATDPSSLLHEQALMLGPGASNIEREEELLSDLDALLEEFTSSELRIDPESARLQIRSAGVWRPFFESAPLDEAGDG